MDHMPHIQALAHISAGEAVTYSTKRGWYHVDAKPFTTTPAKIVAEHVADMVACGVAL